MSLSNTASRVQYSGNGATVAFSVTYPFLLNSHIVAELLSADGLTRTLLALTTDYTLTGAGNPAGGTLTMLVAPPASALLTIRRVIPIQQLASYIANDAFPSATHEQALDILTEICQMLAENLARCIQIPSSDLNGLTVILPNKVNRASKALAFDASGNVITQ